MTATAFRVVPTPAERIDLRRIGHQSAATVVTHRRAIAVRDPGFQFLVQGGPGGDPAVQTLPMQHAQLDFGHVEPTPMLRCGMHLEALPDPVDLGRGPSRRGRLHSAC
ncbi:MAG: hypothetical protein M3490_03500 [Chloroflexota bacterium]|nr:hypothetical protein [Chloroflexota bacterium]